jgi:uncharacterized protein
MEESPPVEVAPRSSWLDRAQALLEILLVSGLVSSFFAALPFSLRKGGPALQHDARLIAAFILLEASITLVFMVALLKAHGEGFSDLGLNGRRWGANALIGLAILPAFFLTNALVSELFRRFLPGFYIDRNPLIDLIRTPRDLALFLLSGIAAGGIKEELQRAFILTRFRQHLGGAWLGLALWSVAFAAGHYLQGFQGVVIAGVLGLLFGILYLVRQSVVAPIVSHAAYDTIVLIGYWFFMRPGN